MLNLGCFGKERKRKKKKGNWKYRRPKWSTARFESSVVTEKVCRDKVPRPCIEIGLRNGAHQRVRQELGAYGSSQD